nr:MAG TPA: hypothetical protein [Bacteriophage sp.]
MWGRGPWPKAEGFFLFMWHYTTIAEYWLNRQYKLFVLPRCPHLLEVRNTICWVQPSPQFPEDRLEQHYISLQNHH